MPSGVVDFRDRIRLCVERGEPAIVFQHGEPAAVVLAHTEIEHWRGIERALSALHGLELYPELARDTAELAGLVRGDVRPSPAAIREPGRRRRTILAANLSSIVRYSRTNRAGCGVVGNARALGARDRRFESDHPDHPPCAGCQYSPQVRTTASRTVA